MTYQLYYYYMGICSTILLTYWYQHGFLYNFHSAFIGPMMV